MTFGLRHALPDWFNDIACADMPLTFFYPHKGANQTYAAKFCKLHCPVIAQCLEWTLAHETSTSAHGVAGGMTESQRARLLRRREIAEMKRQEGAA